MVAKYSQNIFYIFLLSIVLNCSNKSLHQQNVKDEYPKWILNPSKGVVGMSIKSKNSTYDMQKEAALLDAEAKLLRMKKSKVSSTLVLNSDSSGPSINQEINISTSGNIDNLTILKEFIDKEGRLYLWVIK